MYIYINGNNCDFRNLLDESSCRRLQKICNYGPSPYTFDHLLQFTEDVLMSDLSHYDIPITGKTSKQICTEILLLVFNSFSFYLPTLIHGVDDFLSKSIFYSSEFVYSGKNNFDKFVRKANFVKDLSYINVGSPTEPGNLMRTIYTKRNGGTIIENTPLDEYVFSHFISKNDHLNLKGQSGNPLFDIVRLESKSITNSTNGMNKIQSTISEERLNQQEKHLFLEDGRFFSLLLFKLISDRDCIPYTAKTSLGMTINHIHNLSRKLFKAYNDDALKSASIERLLLLFNSEYIFKPSLLTQVMLTYKTLLKSMEQTDMSLFTELLDIMNRLNLCSLSTMKLFLWENVSSILYTEYTGATPEVSILERCSFIDSCIEVSNKLISIVIEALNNIFITSQASSYDSFMSVLRKYLGSKRDAFSWSILTANKEPEMIKLPTDYYNFYILYVLYSTKPQDIVIAKSDLLTPSNQYARFLLRNI